MSGTPTTGLCSKTMLVREATAGNEVHGCAAVHNSFESTIHNEKWFDTSAFDATVSCYARRSDPAVENPFLL